MVENDVVSLFRRCTPEFQATILDVLNAGANAAEREAEKRRKAAHTARIITFKSRADMAKEA